MSTKRRGYESELKAKYILQDEGFLVIRSSASLTPFDLIAVKHNIIRFIQIKRQKSKKLGNYNKDIESMKNIMMPANTQKELWIFVDKIGWTKKIVI